MSWIFIPILFTAFNYVMMYLGVFPALTGVTAPIIFSGFLTVNSIFSRYPAVIDFTIAALIWFSFPKNHQQAKFIR